MLVGVAVGDAGLSPSDWPVLGAESLAGAIGEGVGVVSAPPGAFDTSEGSASDVVAPSEGEPMEATASVKLTGGGAVSRRTKNHVAPRPTMASRAMSARPRATRRSDTGAGLKLY